MRQPTFDEMIRAAVILVALLTVSALAFWFRSESAAGALIGLLGLGGSFLFRGRVQTTERAEKASTLPPAGGSNRESA